MFVGEETFISSGISFIRIRIDYVHLDKSLSFLFHSAAVHSPAFIAFWLLQHISLQYRKPWSHSFCHFGKKSPICVMDHMFFFFLIAEVVPDCRLCIPAFSALGVVRVWAIYKNSHALQNQISIFLPWHIGFQVKLLCCYFRKISSVSSYPCT